MNFREELNEEQFAAVTAPDRPSLVIAAAGTGKTRTLVYRVAWLIEQGVDPNRILLLTFTNKAAREMLERAHELTGGAVSGLLGGTFHHLANRFWPLHGLNVARFLGSENCCPKQERVLTITYAVGGAGAQREAGRQIAESLRPRIEKGEVILNLVAGIRQDVRDCFEK